MMQRTKTELKRYGFGFHEITGGEIELRIPSWTVRNCTETYRVTRINRTQYGVARAAKGSFANGYTNMQGYREIAGDGFMTIRNKALSSGLWAWRDGEYEAYRDMVASAILIAKRMLAE